MIKLSIKTRILVFVIFFEIFAYSSIQLFNNYMYKKELIELKHKEIQQTFIASTEKINNLSQIMERNVIDLAITGEHLYSLKQDGFLDMEALERKAEHLLVSNFTSFPQAIGGGIWFEPYILDETVQYFGPYVFQSEGKVKFSWDLNTPKYDYHNQDWYRIAPQDNWGVNQNNIKPIYWTPPYQDDAGSFSLMMTVDAVMFDTNKQPIGITTVDWELTTLTRFLESVSITENSLPFLIHQATGKILSYPKDPQLIMQQIEKLPWGQDLLNTSKTDILHSLDNIVINHNKYNIYFYQTQSGFIFGSISPLADLEKEANSITSITFFIGSAIGILFIIIVFILMKILFKPFDKVLHLIKNSITHKENNNGIVEVEQIEYSRRNEFTPIIKELNKVYEQVSQNMLEISLSNDHLRKSKNEINSLNEDLEDKVALRTKQLADKTQEVLTSLEQLKNTQKQLVEQEKNASLGRLVAGVAHEINTPLGVCIMSASFMVSKLSNLNERFETGKLSKIYFKTCYLELSESADLLSNNLKRASDLVTSFKEVAVDQSVNEFRQFKLCDYLSKIMRSLQPKLTQKNIALNLIFDGDDFEIYSNPGAISQVISNIIDNALIHGFYGLDSGRITVSVCREEYNITLKISDNGNGMTDETLKCIFDPFFTTTRHAGATGLGMHIVYNLISQQLKSEIKCESELGEGSSVTLKIPIK
jgi:signal transduction histidine kinase